MKAIVLAAGYATRLYPLTKNQPKPLLKIAGNNILDYIVEKMERVEAIGEIIIVTNDKFTDHFEQWKKSASYTKQVTVVNDGTTTNDNRLGAIGDIQYVIETQQVTDDLMVLAGDNLFDFELSDFVTYFYKKENDCITAYKEENEEQLKRAGVVDLTDTGEVISFEEKPSQPKSNYCVPAFYLYKKESLPLFKEYLKEGNNPDAPGHFIPYLITRRKVHAYLFEGKRYDVGTVDSYNEVNQLFSI